jgi:phosphoribosylformylglycinamidine synthase
MRWAVIAFGGSNCDQDAHNAISELGVDCDWIWYKDGLTKSYDAVIIPGGFSYGDYLRAGAIAAHMPIMDDIRTLAQNDGLVLGICNGAQIACESDLVPGVFTRNEYPKFVCRSAYLCVETNESPFTSRFTSGDVIKIPIAHGIGRYVPPAYTSFADVAFRFCNKEGITTPEVNHNGSYKNITGVFGATRNVLAMMPHPERACSELIGSIDGIRIFGSMMDYCENQ